MRDDDNPTLIERLTPWWLTRECWRYLLSRRDRDVPWWRVIRCRLRGHPAGMVFYNPGGLEPDTTCRECGDNIG